MCRMSWKSVKPKLPGTLWATPGLLRDCLTFFAPYLVCYYFIIIGIQPLGRFGQRPELSQSTDTALVSCILGKFLGVVCHCFPPPLDVPTFATRCLNDARDPSGGRWNCGQECCPVILSKWRLPRHLGIFYMPKIYDMGPKEGVLRIFSLEKKSNGFGRVWTRELGY